MNSVQVKVEVPQQMAWVVEWVLKCFSEKKHGSLTLYFHDGGVVGLDDIEKVQPPNQKILDKPVRSGEKDIL